MKETNFNYLVKKEGAGESKEIIDKEKMIEQIKTAIKNITAAINSLDIDFGKKPDGAAGFLEEWRVKVVSDYIKTELGEKEDDIKFTNSILEQMKDLSIKGFTKVYFSDKEDYKASEDDIILAASVIADNYMWHRFDWEPELYSPHALKYLEKYFPHWADLAVEDKQKYLGEVMEALVLKKLPNIKNDKIGDTENIKKIES